MSAVKQRGVFCVAAPVSGVTAKEELCAVTAFSEPCSCEDKTCNPTLAGAVLCNIPPTPLLFCLLKWGGNRRRGFPLISFSVLFVVKEMFNSSCVWWLCGTGGGNQVAGEGGNGENGEQLLCMWGQTLASTLHLSSSPCHSQTLTKIL